MSIINCEKCSKAVDTDYNVEEIVYQNDTAVCSDCVELQAYYYKVRAIDYNADNNRSYDAGWIKAYSEQEAIDKLCDQFHVEDDEVKVSHSGTWERVYNQLINDNG